MAKLLGPATGPLAGGAPRQLVVLLHGVGADGQDLIGLAPMLAERLPHALFVAPDAPQPCDMAPYGRQWFSLQDRRPAAMLAGARRTAPPLDAFLDELLRRHGLDEGRLALVGFSQGTMMSLLVGPRRAHPPAAILGFSGALLGAEDLPREARGRPPVMLVHGDADDVVPVDALFQAAAGLQGAEIPVQWIIRPGLPHSIDPYGIEAGGKFLKDMLGG
jgi:phospholipase/carboxylesterase